MEETLRNSLLALAETGWTLLESEPLLTEKGFRAEVMRGVQDSRVRSFFGRFDALSAANQSMWALAVLNKVTPLLSIPALRHTFGQRQAIPFRTLYDRNPSTIVLAALAADRLHDAARLAGGLLVSSFQLAIMSRADVPEALRTPVHFYIDEFECMASDRFEAIVAEGRRFGLGLTLSHQNLNQLSSNLRHVVRNNVHTQVFFQTGALDAAELTREIGGDTETVRSTLMSQGVGQAYLVRRGQPSVRMQVEHSPDPAVTAEAVAAIRRAAMAVYARPVAEVAAELGERERCRAPRVASEVSESSSAPTYEIRHSKSATFKAAPEAAPPRVGTPRNPTTRRRGLDTDCGGGE